jgi:F-type H+-transporting ATPase subunit b
MIFFAMEEHAFSLLDFRNNVINWIVLVALVAWMMKSLLPPVFAARRERINTALDDAAKARSEGKTFLEEQEKRIANAEKEAEKKIVEAKEVAVQMRAQMEEQTRKEAADLSTKIDQQIANQRQLAITELRGAAARAAIKLSEAGLSQHLNAGAKQKLLDQFTEQLEASRN